MGFERKVVRKLPVRKIRRKLQIALVPKAIIIKVVTSAKVVVVYTRLKAFGARHPMLIFSSVKAPPIISSVITRS
jgi:hypothetical protein